MMKRLDAGWNARREAPRVLHAWRGRSAARAVPALILLIGCAAPVPSLHVVLDRHRAACAEADAAESVRRSVPSTARHAEALTPVLPEVLDLQTARAVAIAGNPDIHAAAARLEGAAARVAEADARYFPTVVLTHNSTRTFQTPASRNRLGTLLQPAPTVPVDLNTNNFALTALLDALRRPLFGGGEAQGDQNSYSEHSTALTASWLAFDGFVRQAALLAAGHVHRASALSRDDVERLVIRAVDAAYFQVQLAEEQLRIAMAAEAFGREQLVETGKLHKAGRATTADVDNFRVRVLAAQAEVAAAAGLRDTGRVVLAELMGLAEATLPARLSLLPLEEETESEMTVPDVSEWMERALAHRPDLSQLAQLLEAEEENVRAARGSYLPTVGVSGSWGFDRVSNLEYSSGDQSSAAGIEVRWDVYTGGALRARVWQAESSRAEAAANLHRLHLAVAAEVRSAVIDLENAQEQIRLHRQTVETARENRRIVQAGYVVGKETLNRLNEAQRDFITSDADLALSRIRLRQAWSDLRAAAGGNS